MNHIVGIIFRDVKTNNLGAFITWGKIYNDMELLEVVYAIRNVKEPKLCKSLHEIKHFLYFYEALWYYSSRKIPADSKEYEKWKKQKRKDMKAGKNFYLLGYIKEDK